MAGNARRDERLRLLEDGERAAGMGSWEWLSVPDEFVCSENLYRIFGVEPRNGPVDPEIFLAQVHLDDRERVRRYTRMHLGSPNPPPIEYRIMRPGHGLRYLRSTVGKVESVEPDGIRMVGAIQDLTEQRLLTREVAAHIAVSKALLEWDRFEVSGRRMLSELGTAIEAVAGGLWIPEHDGLRVRLVWNSPLLKEFAEFERVTLSQPPRRGAGPLSEAWLRRRVVEVPDVRRRRDYRRTDAAGRAGLRGAVAFPAIHRGEVVAVLEFYYSEEVRPDALRRQTLLAVGYELGQFLSPRLGQFDAPALSSRELEVLRLSADGYTRPQIAQKLSIKPTTVATHLKHAYGKLGVTDRASAVATLMRRGLLD